MEAKESKSITLFGETSAILFSLNHEQIYASQSCKFLFCICRDAKNMTADVNAAFCDVLEQYLASRADPNGPSPVKFLETMKDEGRYLVDAWCQNLTVQFVIYCSLPIIYFQSLYINAN